MRLIKFLVLLVIPLLFFSFLFGWLHLRGQSKLFRVNHDWKWGYVDINGKTIINPQFYDVGNFFAGLAKTKIEEKGKYGFID
jgi:hypothetical protein